MDRESIAAEAISNAQKGHIRGSLMSFIAVLRLANVIQERHVGLADALIAVLPDGDGGDDEDEPTPRMLMAEISKVKRGK